MTGPKGNSKFCFLETLDVSQGEAKGNIEFDGKENSLFPAGWVIKCFVIPPNSKVEKLWRNCLLYTVWLRNLPRFQGAPPDQVCVESSCCFPRELMSFVRPRELVSFDPRHVTHFPPIKKCFLVGRYSNSNWQIPLPFHIPQLVKSLPFHVLDVWKPYHFWVEPPCIHVGLIGSNPKHR